MPAQRNTPSWRAAYFDPELNKKVQAAVMEPDDAKRVALYADLQQEVMQKGPMAIMFQMYNTAGINPALKNWTWNGFCVWYNKASK